MNIKQQRQVYFILLAVTFFCAALLWLLKSTGAIPLQGLPETAYYTVSVATTILYFVLLYFGLCSKKHPLEVRLSYMIGCPILVLLDYFFFGDTNLLFLIPIFAIAYLYLWPKENKE